MGADTFSLSCKGMWYVCVSAFWYLTKINLLIKRTARLFFSFFKHKRVIIFSFGLTNYAKFRQIWHLETRFFWNPHICLLTNCPQTTASYEIQLPWTFTFRQLLLGHFNLWNLPEGNYSLDTYPWIIPTWVIIPLTIAPHEISRGQLPPCNFDSRTFFLEKSPWATTPGHMLPMEFLLEQVKADLCPEQLALNNL